MKKVKSRTPNQELMLLGFISYRKKILDQDEFIQQLQKKLVIAESKIPVVEEKPSLYTSVSNYLCSFKS